MSSPVIRLNGSAVPVWGNPLAPQPFGFTPMMALFTDLDSDLSLPISIAAGETLEGINSVPLSIDDGADIIVREFQFAYIGANAGVNPTDLLIRIHDGDGSLVTLEYVTLIDIMGTVPQWGVRRGAQLNFDLRNVGAATITGQLIVKTVKRAPCSNPAPAVIPYVPMYKRFAPAPKGYHDEAYSLYFEVPLTSVPLTQFPLANDIDADFIWRGLGGNGLIAQTLLRLYDSNNVPMFDALTPYECATSQNPGAFAPFSAEVIIPRGGVIYGDFALAPGASYPQTVKLSLRGVKRYLGAAAA
jgi:hypothetical protein